MGQCSLVRSNKQHINKQWTELIGDDSRVGLQTQSALITDSKTVFQMCASLSNFSEMVKA
jgi:hypothetical protein